MFYVPLTRGQVALVDDEDIDLVVAGWPWHCTSHGYAANAAGYMHRVIAGRGPVVDHKNRNKLDNRRSNLRITDAAGNAQNVTAHCDAVSSHRGVWLSVRKGKATRWKAQRMRDGVRYNLGTFLTEAEAVAASEAFDGISR